MTLALAALAVSAGSAVAVGATSCTSGSGFARFSPGLTSTATAENVLVKGALTSCTGSTFTDAKFLAHLPAAGAAAMTCDSVTTGDAVNSWAGTAIVKWIPQGSPNSHATVTATFTGGGNLHITGMVTDGSFAGSTLSTDLTLTARFKTFPPKVKTPPAPCPATNRLRKATYAATSFSIA